MAGDPTKTKNPKGWNPLAQLVKFFVGRFTTKKTKAIQNKPPDGNIHLKRPPSLIKMPSWRLKEKLSTLADIEAKESPTQVLEGDKAVAQSDVPPKVADAYGEASIDYQVSFSIRDTTIGDSPAAQYYKGAFTTKSTSMKSKSIKRICPDTGRFPKYDWLHDKEPKARVKDLKDHEEADFPEGAKKIEFKVNDENRAMLSKGEALIDVAEYNGRLFFKISGPKYRYAENGESGPFVEHGGKKYKPQGEKEELYIQETESVRTILERILNRNYRFESFNDVNGKLIYKESDNDNTYVVYLSPEHLQPAPPPLNDLFKPGEKEAFDFSKADKFKVEDLGFKKFIKKAKDINIEQQARVYNLIKIDEKNQELPNLVHAGTNGPITGDFDLGHVALPKDLPELAFKRINLFSNEGIRDLLVTVDRLLLELKAKDNPCFQALAAKLMAKDPNNPPLRFIDKYLKENLLEKMGSMSMGEFLFSCAFNEASIIRMIEHGPESKNPSVGQSGPEPFGALLHIHKGRKIHTNDEKSCLNFYFFDKEYLEKNYIEVHPSRLVDDNPNKQDWMDLIELQAQNGMDERIRQTFEDMKALYRNAIEEAKKKANEDKNVLIKIENSQEAKFFKNCNEVLEKLNSLDKLSDKDKEARIQEIWSKRNGEAAKFFEERKIEKFKTYAEISEERKKQRFNHDLSMV